MDHEETRQEQKIGKAVDVSGGRATLTNVSRSLLVTGHCVFDGWITKWKHRPTRRIRHGGLSCPNLPYPALDDNEGRENIT